MAQRSARGWPVVVRRVRPDDRAAVLAFASDTWDGWDYIPWVFDAWATATDGVYLAILPGPGAPFEADVPIAVARVAFLTDTEAWIEGIRVDPKVRGLGIATDLQVAELRWAAAHGAEVVRYLTSQTNEASLRLGARHGFEVVGRSLLYGWDTDSRDANPVPHAHGSDPTVPPVLPSIVQSDATDRWWASVAADPTFVSASGLYEPRSWAAAELHAQRFADHVAAGEVLVWEREGTWGLAITKSEAEGEDDPRLPPPPCLVAGDARRVLDLLRFLGGARPSIPEVRLPHPDPPMLADGAAALWAEAGWSPHRLATYILARRIDADHPVPEADPSDSLIYDEEPRRVAAPRRRPG